VGRPKNDSELVAAENQQYLDDQLQGNAVEGRIVQGKRRYGLGVIREMLALTQGSPIAFNVLVMNLQKLLELLFALFSYWLQYRVDDGAGKRLPIERLHIQIAPA
jgi:IS5 family transposase